MKRKAFTLVEIMVTVLLVTLFLGVVYQVFSGTFSQFFKSSNKMTNLRAASLILERLKSDVRAAVIPCGEDEQPIIKDNLICFTRSDIDGKRSKVNYEFDGKEIIRELAGERTRNVNAAKVTGFTVTESTEEDGNKYIVVKIIVDDEVEKDKRSASSKANQVELNAVLYPRFYLESQSDEEKYWNKTRES